MYFPLKDFVGGQNCGKRGMIDAVAGTRSGYTPEKICSLNYHCNDDCNSSLQ